MHIPDGYLNLPTCLATYGVMTPVWTTAAKKLKKTFHGGQVPVVALGAAFSFVLMMFNFPVPGGSSGHAVGGAILAIFLGPWVAVSVLSVVLAVQAFLFHDGGITTLGANAFNMAFILPIVSWLVYRLLADEQSRLFRKALAGAMAGYVGLTISAFTTAVMLGLQPHGASGYAPYPLSVTVPVMVGSHMLVFSWIEGLVTAFVLVWVTQNFENRDRSIFFSGREKMDLSLFIAGGGLLILILLSPLGLLTKKTAFGEWSQEELRKILGYAPLGVETYSKLWRAPFTSYQITGHSLLYGYLASAAIGALAAGFFAIVIAKFLSRENKTTTKFVKTTRGEWALFSMSHFFSDLLNAERIQKQSGFLQRENPRIKLVACLFLIVAAAWIKSSLVLSLFLAVSLILTLTSGISVLWFATRVLVPMAFFSLVLSFPASFSWITPGKPWVAIAPHWILTQEGIQSVLRFCLRATTAVAFSALLSLTTSWIEILRALRVFRIPKVFLFVVEMAYRYIVLLVRLVEQMNVAKNARTIVPGSLLSEQRSTTGRMAYLLNRSLALSENVHMAMEARGYDGEIK